MAKWKYNRVKKKVRDMIEYFSHPNWNHISSMQSESAFSEKYRCKLFYLLRISTMVYDTVMFIRQQSNFEIGFVSFYVQASN